MPPALDVGLQDLGAVDQTSRMDAILPAWLKPKTEEVNRLRGLFARFPLTEEEVEFVSRHRLLDRYEPVYATCGKIAKADDPAAYLHKRISQDAAIGVMLEKSLKIAGISPTDVRRVADLGCGEMRYILAVDSVFPNLENVQLVDTDVARLRGAQARVSGWGLRPGVYEAVESDLRHLGEKGGINGARDVVLLWNPDIAKDQVWQEPESIGRVFDGAVKMLSPGGVFVYGGRLRELSPRFGFPGKYGIEFRAVPLLRETLDVNPTIQSIVETSDIFDQLTPTNFIVFAMNQEQTAKFGKMLQASCDV